MMRGARTKSTQAARKAGQPVARRQIDFQVMPPAESTIGSDRYEITVQGLCVFSTVKVMFTYMEKSDYQFVFLQKTGAVSVGNYASPDSKWIAKHSVVAYGINVVPSLKWIVFWWCAALIFGVVHCAAIRTLRVRRSLCVHCGYAKRQVGLCPECGRSDKVV